MIDSLEGDLETLSVQPGDRDLSGLEGDVTRAVNAVQVARRRTAATRPLGVAGVLAALALGLVAGGALPSNPAQASDLDIFSTRASLAPSTLLDPSR